MITCKRCDGNGVIDSDTVCLCWPQGGIHRGEAHCECGRLAVYEMDDGTATRVPLCERHLMSAIHADVDAEAGELEVADARCRRLCAALDMAVAQRDGRLPPQSSASRVEVVVKVAS